MDVDVGGLAPSPPLLLALRRRSGDNFGLPVAKEASLELRRRSGDILGLPASKEASGCSESRLKSGYEWLGSALALLPE